MAETSRWITNRTRHRLHGLRSQPALTWPELVQRATQARPDQIGVDVFDTVLMRRVTSDHSAAAVVAHRLAASGVWPASPEEYQRARDLAWQLEPDGSLAEWLSSEPFIGLVDPSSVLRAELDIEASLIEAVPGAPEALEQLRGLCPVTFVSDMYLSRDMVHTFLDAEGLIGPADRLVISCEARASKSTGTLYRVAFPRAGADQRVLYIGNNPWSDVTMARDARVEPLPALAANSSRLESIFADAVGTAGPMIAAAIRRARLDLALSGTPDDRVRSAGAELLAPLVVPFLLWVRTQCDTAEARTVDFGSSDGRIVFDVARALPPDHWTGLDLHSSEHRAEATPDAASFLAGQGPRNLPTTRIAPGDRNRTRSLSFGGSLSSLDAMASRRAARTTGRVIDHRVRSLLTEGAILVAAGLPSRAEMDSWMPDPRPLAHEVERFIDSARRGRSRGRG